MYFSALYQVEKGGKMYSKSLTRVLILGLAVITLVGFGFGVERAVAQEDVEYLEMPKQYVGSEKCKSCHQKQYYTWRTTQHSRMAQDLRANKRALIVDWDEKTIRDDLAKLGKKLKVPAKKIYVPKLDEIEYTIGSKWKQRYIVRKKGVLYISPVQYNVQTHRFVNYHEADWNKRPWLKKCGGCHTTGVDLNKQTFSEPAVGCEACHGKGSWHFAQPSAEFIKKEPAIINPAKLTKGVAAQICGSCHNRGKSTKVKGAGWPVGYKPGMAVEAFYTSTSYAVGDKKHMYPNEFSKGHHQQFIDWQKSIHFKEGVSCNSCHYTHAHDLDKSLPWQMTQQWISTDAQTKEGSGDRQCLSCHTAVAKSRNAVHRVHSFTKCVGCHMPRIAKSAESGDVHSHVFVALLPEVTLKNPALPNSCQSCHKHKDQDLNKLNDDLKKIQAQLDWRASK
jgi:hypothetical protein